MVTAWVESGICGFSTIVRCCRVSPQSVEIAIESNCENITELGKQLDRLGMPEILKVPINKNPVYEVAGRCKLHACCPVPCGVLKAAEVELELALMKDVRITFKKDSTVNF